MVPKMNFPTVPLSELYLKGITASAPEKPLVLVVDDEAVIADTLAVILMQDGFATRVAYDGLSALHLARACCPDLLLTDVAMPGMSGVDLAVAVKGDLPDCKVLLISGQATTMDLLASTGTPDRSLTVISKPIHPRDLLACVSQTLQFADAAN